TDASQNVLRALHDHATRLVGELPGRLDRLRVRSGDVVIEIHWSPGAPATGVDRPTEASPAGPPAVASPAAQDVVAVTSPIVGTFYHAPEPGKDPFVQVGDVVEVGQTVGIVEAMKLLNPVAAQVGGTVARICADNGEPVEYGQVLVEFAPADLAAPADMAAPADVAAPAGVPIQAGD
ncbi:MAG: acetyl-CoA carboxylase biotin carboxyl carrier protein, partial [Frankia sp.]